MKTPVLLCILCLSNSSWTQEILTRDAALSQLYSQYDPAHQTAQWVCTEKQSQEDRTKSDVPSSDVPWPCSKEDATVAVELLLMSMVDENGATKIYLVTDAKPDKDPSGYECHACAPEIGVAVFAWQDKHWVIESANIATGTHGAWGDPDHVELVDAGSEHPHHGIVVFGCDGGGGETECRKYLLLPLEKTVKEVWWISDENDNDGDYDPTGKDGYPINWRSSASFRFDVSHQDYNQSHYEYSDIEVISRGRDLQEVGDHFRLKTENWTDLYRFENGQYKRIRHTDFIEAKKPINPTKKLTQK